MAFIFIGFESRVVLESFLAVLALDPERKRAVIGYLLWVLF